MNDNECSGIFMNVQNIRLRIDRRRCIDQSITNFIIKELFKKKPSSIFYWNIRYEISFLQVIIISYQYIFNWFIKFKFK